MPDAKQKPKVLFTASIVKHILAFHLPFLRWFQEQGYEVHVAAKGDEAIAHCDRKYNVPFVRTPFSLGHFRAYRELRRIIEQEQYEVIHCHTPMASVLTRLAARSSRQGGTTVIYTSHGFHFFKGSSWLNWLFYYPVEYWLSASTDVIITINGEDYELVRNRKFRNQATHRIHGIGVDGGRFTPVSVEEKCRLRSGNNLQEENFVLLYVAEFIRRKNHEFVIRAAAILRQKIPKLKILFAGRGILKEAMEELVRELGLEDTIIFLGFRRDIQDVMRMSDVGISASRQEGLGLNLIEEALISLPLIATEDRGHREIIDHGKNGFLYPQNDKDRFVAQVLRLYENEELRESMGKAARSSAQKFLLENTLKDLSRIYLEHTGEAGPGTREKTMI